MFVEKYPYTLPHDMLYDTSLCKAIHQSPYTIDTDKFILHIHIWPSKYDNSDIFALFPEEQIRLLQNRQAILFIEYAGDSHQNQEHIDTFRNLCRHRNIDCDLLFFAVSNDNLKDPEMNFIPGMYAWNWVYFGLQNLHPQTFPNYKGGDVLNDINWSVWKKMPDELFTTYVEQYNHKKQHGSKNFMLLQRSIRPHRDLTYLRLLEEGLWTNNNCSYLHRDIFLQGEKEKLLSIKNNQEYYKTWEHSEYAKNSWLAIVSEDIDYRTQPYMTEKWYQAVFNCLPMIFLGPQHSLELFRSFGFKTFDKYFNECYDKQSSYEDRLNEVVKLLRKIEAIQDKLTWYESMRDVLEHNYNHARSMERPDNLIFKNFVKKFNGALRSIK